MYKTIRVPKKGANLYDYAARNWPSAGPEYHVNVEGAAAQAPSTAPRQAGGRQEAQTTSSSRPRPVRPSDEQAPQQARERPVSARSQKPNNLRVQVPQHVHDKVESDHHFHHPGHVNPFHSPRAAQNPFHSPRVAHPADHRGDRPQHGNPRRGDHGHPAEQRRTTPRGGQPQAEQRSTTPRATTPRGGTPRRDQGRSQQPQQQQAMERSASGHAPGPGTSQRPQRQGQPYPSQPSRDATPRRGDSRTEAQQHPTTPRRMDPRRVQSQASMKHQADAGAGGSPAYEQGLPTFGGGLAPQELRFGGGGASPRGGGLKRNVTPTKRPPADRDGQQGAPAFPRPVQANPEVAEGGGTPRNASPAPKANKSGDAIRALVRLNNVKSAKETVGRQGSKRPLSRAPTYGADRSPVGASQDTTAESGFRQDSSPRRKVNFDAVPSQSGQYQQPNAPLTRQKTGRAASQEQRRRGQGQSQGHGQASPAVDPALPRRNSLGDSTMMSDPAPYTPPRNPFGRSQSVDPKSHHDDYQAFLKRIYSRDNFGSVGTMSTIDSRRHAAANLLSTGHIRLGRDRAWASMMGKYASRVDPRQWDRIVRKYTDQGAHYQYVVGQCGRCEKTKQREAFDRELLGILHVREDPSSPRRTRPKSAPPMRTAFTDRCGRMREGMEAKAVLPLGGPLVNPWYECCPTRHDPALFFDAQPAGVTSVDTHPVDTLHTEFPKTCMESINSNIPKHLVSQLFPKNEEDFACWTTGAGAAGDALIAEDTDMLKRCGRRVHSGKDVEDRAHLTSLEECYKWQHEHIGHDGAGLFNKCVGGDCAVGEPVHRIKPLQKNRRPVDDTRATGRSDMAMIIAPDENDPRPRERLLRARGEFRIPVDDYKRHAQLWDDPTMRYELTFGSDSAHRSKSAPTERPGSRRNPVNHEDWKEEPQKPMRQYTFAKNISPNISDVTNQTRAAGMASTERDERLQNDRSFSELCRHTETMRSAQQSEVADIIMKNHHNLSSSMAFSLTWDA